jgi:uncharacterized protein
VPTDDGLPIFLDDAECRRLLATVALGRLGFTDGALPAILPVPFAVYEGHVVIPAREGSPVVAAVRGAVVALEVDRFDHVTETGWSVTVVGPSRVVSDPEEVRTVRGRGLPDRWLGPGRCLIRVHVGLVRGWYVPARPAEPTPEEPPAGRAPPTVPKVPLLERTCHSRGSEGRGAAR